MNAIPTSPSDEQRHKDKIEGAKTFYDLFKHVTTLSTGSLLLMSTLLKRKEKGVKSFVASSWCLLEPSLTYLALNEIQFAGLSTM